MEAFYASIEAEITPWSDSDLHEPLITRPSEKILKAWQLLRDLKARQDANGNVREFKEIVTKEKALCTKLDSLEQKKRELEEEITATKAEIARFTVKRDTVAKRKRQVFEDGKVMRSKKDGLMNKVPWLKAEMEWAFLTETNIEAEWSKLGKQVLQNTSFVEDWI
ncbi:hypothetical protein PIB30_009754 [Stylosanthes scabra]|uniref:Uncharacterized protein n=1 Tax=Stylosanthes scabra TaxID=79078 RepID=A0ABU6X2L7_9FABA|nr:hypothetical protein [Stylosanthes scabra]